jgi:hypothetical protein
MDVIKCGIRGYKLMAFGAPDKNPENSPRIISIEVGDKFYEELQRQLADMLSTLTPGERFAILLVLVGFSLLSEGRHEIELNTDQSENSLIWSYLSQLQKELPEGKALGDLLREANIQLVVNGKPIELHDPRKSADGELADPFENFKHGWDDAMNGRTMSFEEFERRMLEDAD